MKNNKKKIARWLLLGCFMIFLMVIVGGVTRLKHAGLSITDYKIITGIIPPLSEPEWHIEFDKYKQYPEYQKINFNMTLKEYKQIYFWEWFHRFLGRVLGLVFFFPFLYFLIIRALNTYLLKRLLLLFSLGAFQGFLGWYMVKSGLLENPDVSHFRLSAHLVLAFFMFAVTFWIALDLIYQQRNRLFKSNKFIIRLLQVGLVMFFIQIVWGGFVAGLDAGLVHNTWPLMSDGQFIHTSVFLEKPTVFENITSGKSGVQLIHRLLAYSIFIISCVLYFKKGRLNYIQRISINCFFYLVIIQTLLGVLTLVLRVPILIALLHQIVAFITFMNILFALHRVKK